MDAMEDLSDHAHHFCDCLHHVSENIPECTRVIIESIADCIIQWRYSPAPPSPTPIAPQSELESLLPIHNRSSPPSVDKVMQKRLDRYKAKKEQRDHEQEQEQGEISALMVDTQPEAKGGMSLGELTRQWEPEVTLEDIAREEAAQAERDRREAEGRDEGFGKFETGPATR